MQYFKLNFKAKKIIENQIKTEKRRLWDIFLNKLRISNLRKKQTVREAAEKQKRLETKIKKEDEEKIKKISASLHAKMEEQLREKEKLMRKKLETEISLKIKESLRKQNEELERKKLAIGVEIQKRTQELLR